MARIFPEHVTSEMRADPRRSGEVRTYRALANSLSDAYSVFYSVPWRGRTRDGTTRDGEADFLILHPRLGLLVIEVKGGEISHDPRTEEWVSTSARGQRHRIKDPYRQAEGSKYNLVALLREIPELEGTFLPAAHAVVFPDTAVLEGSLGPGLEPITAMSTDLRTLGAFIERVMSSVVPASGFRLMPRQRHAIEQFLGRSFRLSATVAVGAARAEERIIELSERQLDLLSFIRRHPRVEIAGGAGTGKTMLAKEAARRLVAEGRHVAWICFNRPLRDRVATELSSLEGVEVMTFHQLCLSLAREAKITLPDTNSADYFTRLPDALLEALDALPNRRFDALVIDETQDLSEEWWDLLLLCLSDPEADPVFSFRDDNQLVYEGGASRSELQSFELDTNLRNTRQIHAMTRGLYRGAAYRSSDISGPAPSLRESSTDSWLDELTVVLLELLSEGFEPSQLVILTAMGRDSSGLPIGGTVAGRTLRWLEHASDDDIAVETVRRFKGLESTVIVLMEIGPMLEGASSGELSYVALSRARGYLMVLASGPELATLRQMTGR